MRPAFAGMISIEQPCPADLTDAQVATLAKIPTLMVFGDHLGDVAGGIVNWQTAHDTCSRWSDKMQAAGGDAEMMHLPKLGLKGNSHMLMQDKNSLEIADLVIEWIDEHVERS